MIMESFIALVLNKTVFKQKQWKLYHTDHKEYLTELELKIIPILNLIWKGSNNKRGKETDGNHQFHEKESERETV